MVWNRLSCDDPPFSYNSCHPVPGTVLHKFIMYSTAAYHCQAAVDPGSVRTASGKLNVVDCSSLLRPSQQHRQQQLQLSVWLSSDDGTLQSLSVGRPERQHASEQQQRLSSAHTTPANSTHRQPTYVIWPCCYGGCITK